MRYRSNAAWKSRGLVFQPDFRAISLSLKLVLTYATTKHSWIMFNLDRISRHTHISSSWLAALSIIMWLSGKTQPAVEAQAHKCINLCAQTKWKLEKKNCLKKGNQAEFPNQARVFVFQRNSCWSWSVKLDWSHFLIQTQWLNVQSSAGSSRGTRRCPLL